MLNELKKSGEKHKEIMQFLRQNVKPGYTAQQIVSNIEDMIKTDPSAHSCMRLKSLIKFLL